MNLLFYDYTKPQPNQLNLFYFYSNPQPNQINLFHFTFEQTSEAIGHKSYEGVMAKKVKFNYRFETFHEISP